MKDSQRLLDRFQLHVQIRQDRFVFFDLRFVSLGFLAERGRFGFFVVLANQSRYAFSASTANVVALLRSSNCWS